VADLVVAEAASVVVDLAGGGSHSQTPVANNHEF
jgi:hypothetical protein